MASSPSKRSKLLFSIEETEKQNLQAFITSLNEKIDDPQLLIEALALHPPVNSFSLDHIKEWIISNMTLFCQNAKYSPLMLFLKWRFGLKLTHFESLFKIVVDEFKQSMRSQDTPKMFYIWWRVGLSTCLNEVVDGVLLLWHIAEILLQLFEYTAASDKFGYFVNDVFRIVPGAFHKFDVCENWKQRIVDLIVNGKGDMLNGIKVRFMPDLDRRQRLRHKMHTADVNEMLCRLEKEQPETDVAAVRKFINNELFSVI